MALRSLANRPAAFSAGFVGGVGYDAITGWAYAYEIGTTRASVLLLYGAVVVVPFLLFVIGVDQKRWEDHYWFSDAGKADSRQMWIRWGVYAVGLVVGYALTGAYGTG
jgi:hypothetical protein